MKFVNLLIFASVLLSNQNVNASFSGEIHVFGDSHSVVFTGIQRSVIHPMGAITMHRIGRDKLSFINLKEQGVKEGDIAVFTFGEIDVRCHVGIQRDKYNRAIDEILDVLVANYLSAIKMNQNLYEDLPCIVYSVTPPSDLYFNPLYPYYGTLEDRVSITQKLNKKLSIFCQLSNIYFLDIYEHYVTEKGFLDISYSEDFIHIHQTHNGKINAKLNDILEAINHR